MNQDYTNSWIVGFDEKALSDYHNKFFKRFEKNIKHYQQVNFTKKYLTDDAKWLDAPIGSGRLTNELKCREMLGFDKSPQFVKYNNDRGIKTVEGDLLEMQFENSFDLVTCIHTLFAFNCFMDILKRLVNALKKNGVLIVDIVNSSHIKASEKKCGKYPYDSAMDKEEITKFFDSLGCEVLEIIPHDIFDSRYAYKFFWGSKNIVAKLLKRILYEVINRLYFILKLQRVFDRLSRGRDEKWYAKYLVAVRKK